MTTVKSYVSTLQKKLGVVPDGIWGSKSTSALKQSPYQLSCSLEFKKHLPVSTKLGYTDEAFNTLVANLSTINNPVYLAYILATIYHETAGSFRPLEEIGKGKAYKYGKVYTVNNRKVGYRNSKQTYLYSEYPHLYYGRGYVQLTWLDNYLKFGKLLNVDLANKPELACTPKIATDITLLGMSKGLFTGYSLEKAFKNYGTVHNDWIQARKIINGTDKADKIAAEAKTFLKYITLKEKS